MFNENGRIYIYFIYGNHYCFNIVARNKQKSEAGAVLIRAVLPTDGINIMRILRGTNDLYKLASGPGKLTQAFKISKKQNNLDLTDVSNKFIYIENDRNYVKVNNFEITSTQRIGITKGMEKKWRFIMINKSSTGVRDLGNPYLSKCKI